MKVLVIDDDEDVRELFQAVLTEAGCAVVCAADGQEGLSALESQAIDLVITDVLMPVIEGVETILAIKKRYPRTPVIAISGGGRVKNLRPLEIAGSAGADVALVKPIEPRDLLAAVSKALAAA